MAGQIIRRGDRKWCVRVFLGNNEHGKRVYQNRSVSGAKKDAEKVLAEMLRTRSLGPSILRNERLLVDELLNDLIREYTINGRAVGILKMKIEKYLRPSFGKLQASKINTASIEGYADSRLMSGAAVATVNRELGLLRRAFSLGYQCEPRKVERIPRIKLFKENNVRKGFFEHEHYKAMLQALPDHLKAVLVMGYWTGLRRGEITSLKWEQVDLRNGVLRLEAGTTKSGEGRIVPLAPDLWECLKMQRERSRLEYPECVQVFHYRGKPFKDFRDGWDTAAAKAGLIDEKGKPKLLFHDLRRSAVRNLLRGGVPEKVAMAISGHKTRAVFDRYNIVAESDLRTAITRLSGYISQQEGEAEKGSIGTQNQNPHTIRTSEASGVIN
ncbi:MAG: site-specific integrase [Acidobacteria bacterium]|nr:site-specific integrase [Acidobacteriota bacterium]